MERSGDTAGGCTWEGRRDEGRSRDHEAREATAAVRWEDMSREERDAEWERYEREQAQRQGDARADARAEAAPREGSLREALQRDRHYYPPSRHYSPPRDAYERTRFLDR